MMRGVGIRKKRVIKIAMVAKMRVRRTTRMWKEMGTRMRIF